MQFDRSTLTRDHRDISRGAALKFVVLLGVVSLFSDMTYEGRGASPVPISPCSARAASSWDLWPGSAS